MLLSSSFLKLDLVLHTAWVLPRSGGQLVSGCHLSECCDHVRKNQIYSNTDEIIILFMEMQAGGRGRVIGTWLVLTQAGGRQWGHVTLNLLRLGGSGKGGKVLPWFCFPPHQHLPAGAAKPFCSRHAAWKMNTVSV